MFIRSRSTDTLTRTTAASATATPRRTSPSPSRVSRTFSATAPIPIPVVSSNPHSISPQSTLSHLNMFRRSSSVAMLQPTKHREAFSHTAPIYVPRSSATHIPTPSHPTPHASSSSKRGGKHHNNNNTSNNHNNKSTRAPMMARAPRVRRNRRPFKASSSSRARGEHHDSYDPRDGDMDPPCEEHIQNELPTTLTGSWQDSPVLPIMSQHAGTSPPSLTLSRSTSATSETSSTPDLILFSDHSDHTMSPASSMSTISTPSTSSSSSPIMLSSSLSSSASPVLTYHTPAASDYELVNDSSLTAGQCGSYLVRARQTNSLSIFKPQDEEMYEEKRLLLDMATQNKSSGVRITEVESPRSDNIPGSISMVDVVDKTPIKKGIVYGDAALKEVAAYLMDHESFAGVPPTISTSLVLKRGTSENNNKEKDTLSSALVQFGPTPPGELVFGSLQEYRQHMCSAEDIGSSLFGIDEVHKIGVLDIRLLNLDRHLGNLLVSKDDNGYHLIPIDHGYTLPSYQDLSDVALEWRWWRQSAAAFSQRTLEYIAQLDPLEDARVLRMLGIRDESLVSLVFSTMLLQRAAQAGLTLQTIASMVCRDGLGETPSTLEMIISQVLALMKSGADVTLQDVTAASTATTTTNSVDPATSNEPTATAEAPTEKPSNITTTLSSLSIQPSDDDSIVSPTCTSLPIKITPPTGSPAASPVASPCSSSVSSSYSSSPSGSSVSSSLSSLTNFSLKPSPSIQRLFSFATLPTVNERSHTRNSSTCESHVEEEEEEEEEEEVESELLDHESFPSWESDGEHETEEMRARIGSMSSSNESGSEEDQTRSPTRRRGSRKSSSSPIPNNVDSPTSSSSSPPSSLPVVPADDLSDRLARLLHTTTVVIDREVARIKSNMTSTAQA